MSEMKKLTPEEIPTDVLERMAGNSGRGRNRTELRRQIEALDEGEVLDTGLESADSRNARRVRAMVDNMLVQERGNRQFSVISSKDANKVLVWRREDKGRTPLVDDRLADEQLARDNGEWEQR